MKYQAVILCLCATAAAQQQTSSYTYDINGNPVHNGSTAVSKLSSGSERRDTVQSLNGRAVPVQSVEERVISDSGGVKIVERIVKRYDANGNPGPPDKIRVEERKNPDGSALIQTSTMSADINGNYQLAERTQSEIRKSGETTTTNTSVQRPTLNGSLELIEKREETRREAKDGSFTQDAKVYARDNNGRFGETARESIQRVVNGNNVTENAAVYEATNGQPPQLVRQTVSRITKSGDKAEHREVDVFVADNAGQVSAAGEQRPRLQERQIIEKSPTAGGAVERVSVQRPSINDPGKLGAPQKVGETICRGECK